MSTQLNEFNEEEALLKKKRQKRRVRGVLILTNLLLLSYFSYLIIDLIIDKVKESDQILKGDIITLRGKSVDESNKLYEKYIANRVDVNDVATYGNYLLTSSTRVNKNSFHYEEGMRLINLISSPFYVDTSLNYKLGSKLDEQLDLFSLEEGDYMICKTFNLSENKGVCYHYTGENLFEKTLYSLPDSTNHRKKITLKGKASSPALIISIETINFLPNGYSDFVVLGEEKDFDIFKDTSYQVTYCSSLKEAYLTKASFAIKVLDDQEGIYTSNYVKTSSLKPELLTVSEYASLDRDNFIRELGGYVFNSGFGVDELALPEDVKEASLEIKKTNDEMKLGKFAISVGKNTSLDQIKEVFNIK